MGLKLCKPNDIGEAIRKIAWPNEDDTAQRIYEKAKNKDLVDLKYGPKIESYARRTLTIGIIIATILYASSCDGKKQDNENNNYNELLKYSSNFYIQK